MKSSVRSVVTENFESGVRRAENTIGVALQEWLESEEAKKQLEFSDIVLAMHFVIARASAKHALSKCLPRNAASMKRQYLALAALCLDDQFELLMKKQHGV